MQTLTVDGVPLHYRDVGQGLPVLLLHAFPLNGAAFDKQVAALSGRYRFIIPDHRGFGASQLGAGPTEMSRIARDALALLDALKVDSAVVGGVSMGGYAAMALLREDAGRVRGLVRDAWVPSAGAEGTRHTLDLPAGERRRVATTLCPTRRGDRPATGVTVRTHGPLGLAGRQGTVRVPGAVRSLPPVWRAVLLARDRDRRPAEQVADDLGISLAQQRRILNRARAAVRDEVAGRHESRGAR